MLSYLGIARRIARYHIVTRKYLTRVHRLIYREKSTNRESGEDNPTYRFLVGLLPPASLLPLMWSETDYRVPFSASTIV